ncbi:Breast cancer type 2 susceptibility protein like [Pseudolycoriella hygida]|uniref:Breast cancer type 2 susceptibility protein like n=1 Tax=Pseudolycoriella hygida TaxID=35572 RepID=A0A9Q0S540_9DIPT|nr:Breast cancer type 2 susceptibility protein like [Pseudolycoriella hygida]
MEEEIGASPTSQKKRKKNSKNRASQKVHKSEGCSNTNVISREGSNENELKKLSNCLTRRDILQDTFNLEKADRSCITESRRIFNRLYDNRNELRMSGRAGFMNVTQLTQISASQSLKVNEVTETQWDVTESQFRKLDESINKFRDLEKVRSFNSMENGKENHEARHLTGENDEQSVENNKKRESSLKRGIPMWESILSEWTTSPEKKQKTQSELLQLSPKFTFNRKRCKKTYLRKRNFGGVQSLVPNNKSPLQGTHQEQCTTENVIDEDVDLNKSLHIIDNIQSLSQFYTQSSNSMENDVNETFKIVMNMKSARLNEPTASLYDEEDFLGFDNESKAATSINLPKRLCEFSTNSISSTHSVPGATEWDKDLLMGDDELFASFQTQQNGNYVTSAATANDCVKPAISSNPMNGNSMFCRKVDERLTDTGVRTTRSKARNLFDDIEKDFEFTLGRSNVSFEAPSKMQFSSAASMFPVATRNETRFSSLKKCSKEEDENLIADPDYESVLQRFRSNLSENPTFAGFTTLTGRPISVTSEMISKNKNIFHNVEVSADEIKKMSTWIDDNDSSTRPINSLFTCTATAGGSHIPASSTLLSKTSNFFQNMETSPDELKPMDNWIDSNESNRAPSSTFAGFTTAAGKEILVSPDLLTRKSSIFQNVRVSEEELRKMNWFDDKESTSDLSGVKQSNSDHDPPKRSFASFTTASGAHIPVSSEMMNNKTNFFQNVKVSEEEIDKMDSWISDDKGTKSTDLFREVTNIAQRETDTKRVSVQTLIKPSPLRKMSMVNSLRKLEVKSLKENSGAGGSFSPITPTTSRSLVYVTPTNNSKTFTQEAREIAQVILQDDEKFADQSTPTKGQTPGYATAFKAELNVASTPIHRADNFRNRPTQRRLVEKFDDLANEAAFEADVSLDSTKVRVSSDIISLRRQALDEQQRNAGKKSNVKAVPSVLFIKKLTSTQVNWREFVENSRPANTLPTTTKLSSNVLNVTAEDAAQFKFNGWDYYSEEYCRENVDGIFLPDDIVVIMDQNCQIGVDELSAAFLNCPSVDPSLIHHKWIENHTKWIVLKLAAMERSFPNRFAGQALTLNNFVMQLKYRYEREIDRVERSAIRKICEMDDVPAKRMVLFVARISKGGSICEIELSDGWYSLPSTLDYEMTKFVNNGKIKLGTKLVIQGASALGLDSGCHPLDVASNVKLKICANSTRRVRWDTKLGYCKNSTPFTITLRSVLSSGGNISKLRICVLRVYPVVYINPKKLSDVHSEKVERRRTVNDEREKLSLVEKVYSQVCKELEEEEKTARYENQPLKIVKMDHISSITDPAYLCDLMDEDVDPARIENQMTAVQKEMVLNYKDRMNCLRSETIRTRVNEKLSLVERDTRKFVPLLRFKITDENSFDKTAVVTIWKPTEEMLSLIKEGTVYELTGSSARGTISNELQIYAGKDAIFRKFNVVNQTPASLVRRHITILDILSLEHIPLNEVDTSGMVVHLGEISQRRQPVYIADADENIVCIYFFQSVKDFAVDDIVQVKQILAIKNLQLRKTSNSKPIPCAYANENTIFTVNPHSSELCSAIESLKSRFQTVELNEFMESCMGKIRAHNFSLASTPVRKDSSLLQKTSSYTSPLPGHSPLNNQSRIELLSKYGDAMATPPLHINCVNNSFKLPVSKT